MFVLLSRFKSVYGLEAQAKTLSKTFKNIGDCSLVWVPCQVQSELHDVQGGTTDTGWKKGPPRDEIAEKQHLGT